MSKLVLYRRGVRHGRFDVASARAPRAADRAARARIEEDQRMRWERDEPIVLRGALVPMLRAHAGAIRSTLALFERLRREGSFQDEVWRRVHARSGFVPAGTTIDLGDEREIEKVFADARRGGRMLARDLYAKLSWISFDRRDPSLRIRFSFGAEALRDWQKETRRAPWADRFASALFPECEVIAENAPLRARIEALVGRSVRFSERIVYSNSPGGGAVFHHDDEPFQLGVVYGQLAGATSWLALSKRQLARHVAAAARGRLRRTASTPRAALRALDRDGNPLLRRLLDSTPSFTRSLAEAGALHVLRPGDAILLPSHGPDDACWHSVFALGGRPSLAHSYGIFGARRTREEASTLA
jgi:hypothetical protein